MRSRLVHSARRWQRQPLGGRRQRQSHGHAADATRQLVAEDTANASRGGEERGRNAWLEIQFGVCWICLDQEQGFRGLSI